MSKTIPVPITSACSERNRAVLDNCKFGRYFHRAVRVRDMEATRHFYEDIIGLPLVGIHTNTTDHATGEPCVYTHTFFSLGDGSSLAFFQFDDDRYPYVQRSDSYMDHHSILAREEKTIHEGLEKLKTHGIKHIVVPDPLCLSVYMEDPDGDTFEIAHLNDGALDALIQSDAHEILQKWMAEHGSSQKIIPRTLEPITFFSAKK